MKKSLYIKQISLKCILRNVTNASYMVWADSRCSGCWVIPPHIGLVMVNPLLMLTAGVYHPTLDWSWWIHCLCSLLGYTTPHWTGHGESIAYVHCWGIPPHIGLVMVNPLLMFTAGVYHPTLDWSWWIHCLCSLLRYTTPHWTGQGESIAYVHCWVIPPHTGLVRVNPLLMLTAGVYHPTLDWSGWIHCLCSLLGYTTPHWTGQGESIAYAHCWGIPPHTGLVRVNPLLMLTAGVYHPTLDWSGWIHCLCSLLGYTSTLDWSWWIHCLCSLLGYTTPHWTGQGESIAYAHCWGIPPHTGLVMVNPMLITAGVYHPTLDWSWWTQCLSLLGYTTAHWTGHGKPNAYHCWGIPPHTGLVMVNPLLMFTAGVYHPTLDWSGWIHCLCSLLGYTTAHWTGHGEPNAYHCWGIPPHTGLVMVNPMLITAGVYHPTLDWSWWIHCLCSLLEYTTTHQTGHGESIAYVHCWGIPPHTGLVMVNPLLMLTAGVYHPTLDWSWWIHCLCSLLGYTSTHWTGHGESIAYAHCWGIPPHNGLVRVNPLLMLTAGVYHPTLDWSGWFDCSCSLLGYTTPHWTGQGESIAYAHCWGIPPHTGLVMVNPMLITAGHGVYHTGLVMVCSLLGYTTTHWTGHGESIAFTAGVYHHTLDWSGESIVYHPHIGLVMVNPLLVLTAGVYHPTLDWSWWIHCLCSLLGYTTPHWTGHGESIAYVHCWGIPPHTGLVRVIRLLMLTAGVYHPTLDWSWWIHCLCSLLGYTSTHWTGHGESIAYAHCWGIPPHTGLVMVNPMLITAGVYHPTLDWSWWIHCLCSLLGYTSTHWTGHGESIAYAHCWGIPAHTGLVMVNPLLMFTAGVYQHMLDWSWWIHCLCSLLSHSLVI